VFNIGMMVRQLVKQYSCGRWDGLFKLTLMERAAMTDGMSTYARLLRRVPRCSVWSLGLPRAS
jgi:hypothetical protein